jgi:hypothetical protein
MNITSRSLLATVVALSLAVPGVASADRRGGDRYYDHGGRYGHHDGYRNHHRDRHHYYRGHRDRYVTRYYRHDDDDDLLLGLAIGGLLGYAIPRYPSYYYYDRY